MGKLHIDTWAGIWDGRPYVLSKTHAGTDEYDRRMGFCGPDSIAKGCHHSYVWHSPPHEEGDCERVAGHVDHGR